MSLAEKSEVFLFWSSIALSRWLSFVMLSSGVGTTVMHVTRAILFRLLAFLEAFMDYCIVSMHGSYSTLRWMISFRSGCSLRARPGASFLYCRAFGRLRSCSGRKEKCLRKTIFITFCTSSSVSLFIVFHCLWQFVCLSSIK